MPAWQIDHTADQKLLLLLILDEEIIISTMHLNVPAYLTSGGPT